jgi:hypothetical protein
VLRRELPNGQTLLVHGRWPEGHWELELEGVRDAVIVGSPLNLTLADLLGYDVANEEYPAWIDQTAEEIERS